MNMRVETRERVMTVVFDRPERRNAITGAMYGAIADALKAAAEDAGVRAVLLVGTTDCFTSGNDVEDFLKHPPQGTGSPVFEFLTRIAAFPKPLVAAPCGPAVGVGTTMLLHCDLVYAGDNARFQTPFTQLGLCPEAASSLLLPLAAGWQGAAEKLLLGEPFGPEEALRMGFVNRVLAPADAIEHAGAKAAKLASLPPASLRESKRLMKSGLAELAARRMAEEGEVFRRLLGAPEAREALSAFLEKRPPDFSRFD
jgi:enoyl-CoA hydratase/carnithine racemase